MEKQFKNKNKKQYFPTIRCLKGFRPVFGVGEGRETSRKVPTCLGNVFGNRGINLKQNQKIEILKHRYNTSLQWSYGSGVGTVRIPVKNCIDSCGQILQNRFVGPVTSK